MSIDTSCGFFLSLLPLLPLAIHRAVEAGRRGAAGVGRMMVMVDDGKGDIRFHAQDYRWQPSSTLAGECTSIKACNAAARQEACRRSSVLVETDVPDAAHWCCCCCCVGLEGRRAGARKAEEKDGAQKARATQSFMLLRSGREGIRVCVCVCGRWSVLAEGTVE